MPIKEGRDGRGRREVLTQEQRERIGQLRKQGLCANEVVTLTGLPKNPVYAFFKVLAAREESN